MYVYAYVLRDCALGADGSFPRPACTRVGGASHEQALVSLKLKKPVEAGVGRTFAVGIEGG